MPGRDNGDGWPAAAASLVMSAVGRWRTDRPAQASPLVVAIDGHGAAGKSTIAGLCAAETGVTLIHTDDFFTSPARSADSVRPGRTGDPTEAEQVLGSYYDWRRLREQALQPLLERRGASFRRFDWDRGGGLDGVVCVAPGDVVIVEGVFSAAPALSDLVGRSVFVDTPEPERLRRLRGRIAPEEWDDHWLAAEQAYFSLVRPPQSFDLVVPGSDPVVPVLS
jgi:uridine kinase